MSCAEPRAAARSSPLYSSQIARYALSASASRRISCLSGPQPAHARRIDHGDLSAGQGEPLLGRPVASRDPGDDEAVVDQADVGDDRRADESERVPVELPAARGNHRKRLAGVQDQLPAEPLDDLRGIVCASRGTG